MENSLQPYEQQHALVQHQSVFFNIKAFEDGQRMATLLAQSQLIPPNFQKNLPDCLIALELAMRIGASPMAVMQNTYIVHGRPGYSAQFVIAMINSCGRYSPLRFELTGEGDDRTCYAWAYELTSRDKLTGPVVSIEMAKAEGWWSKKDKNGKETSKWQTLAELMLRYRAAAFFGRLYAPELLMGIQTAEEIYDTSEPAATGPSRSAGASDLNSRFGGKGPIIEAEVIIPPQSTQSEAGTAPTNPPDPLPPSDPATIDPSQPAGEPSLPPPPGTTEILSAGKKERKKTSKPPASTDPPPYVDIMEAKIATFKEELDGIKNFTELFRWPKNNQVRLAEELPHEDDRGEVLAYAIYREHCESINDCETVQSINEWAEVKMPSFFKAIEANHQPSANHLYAMVQKAALTRIDALRRLEGKQSEEGVAGSGYSTEYLRFQEQLYSRMNSLDLDRWAFAVQASIDKLNPNEKAALFAEIGERRTELQKSEAVAGQQE